MGLDIETANAAASSGYCCSRVRSFCSVASSRAILTFWSGSRESPPVCISLREEICGRVNGAIEISKQCRVHHLKVCVTCASPSRLGIDRRTAAEVYCGSFCNLNSQLLPPDAIDALFRAEATLVAARRSRALRQCNAMPPSLARTLTPHPHARTGLAGVLGLKPTLEPFCCFKAWTDTRHLLLLLGDGSGKMAQDTAERYPTIPPQGLIQFIYMYWAPY